MARYSSGDRTREALIQAAGELAAERGFSRVTTREVARQAGENVGSIHYHFGGKEQLFDAVVRRAVEPQIVSPLAQVLGPWELGPDDPVELARALAAAVRWFMRRLFDRSRPRWCGRVIYQLLQSPGPLRDMVLSQSLEPSVRALQGLIRRIDRSMDDEEALCEILIICAPIFFHADHRALVADRLGVTELSDEYLSRLERRIVRRSLLALGLPDERR